MCLATATADLTGPVLMMPDDTMALFFLFFFFVQPKDVRAAESEYLHLFHTGKSESTGTRLEMFEEFVNEEEAKKSGWKQKKYGKTPKASGSSKPKVPRKGPKKKAVEKVDKNFTQEEVNLLFQ